MKTIITHPGQAHRDDFYSLSILLASIKQDVQVFRRNPTSEDFSSSTTYILDVGGKFDPNHLWFDHHIGEFVGKPVSTLTMILEYLGLAKKFSRFPWVDFSALMDNAGPSITAEVMEMDSEVFYTLESPLENYFLRMFGNINGEVPLSCLEVMEEFGLSLITTSNDLDARIELLKSTTQIQVIKGLSGLLIKVDSNPTFGVAYYIKEEFPNPDHITWSICKDDRGPGLTLYRYKDNPLINFNKITDKGACLFIHPNGFVAKTKKLDWEEAKTLIGQAIEIL